MPPRSPVDSAPDHTALARPRPPAPRCCASGSGGPPTGCVGRADPMPDARLHVDGHSVVTSGGRGGDITVEDVRDHVRFRACAWIAVSTAARQTQPQLIPRT